VATWRDVIKNAARSIKRRTPSNDSWANQLTVDPDRFDKWLEEDSPACPPLSHIPKRIRPSDFDVRHAVRTYCEIENKQNSDEAMIRIYER
jgi:hypothetical protein